jgi:transcriptional regulator with XRE-family HTH domain
MEESKSRRPNEIQGTGQRLAANLARLRYERRISTRALEGKLSELGRPILANGITKIEKGGRHVDVDDLVALARALKVTPNALLLPPSADADLVDLTPNTTASALAAWRWARGVEQLPEPPPEENGGISPIRFGEAADFARENRPDDPEVAFSLRDMEAHEEVLGPVYDAVRRARADGLSTAQIFKAVEFYEAFRPAAESFMRSISDPRYQDGLRVGKLLVQAVGAEVPHDWSVQELGTGSARAQDWLLTRRATEQDPSVRDQLDVALAELQRLASKLRLGEEGSQIGKALRQARRTGELDRSQVTPRLNEAWDALEAREANETDDADAQPPGSDGA